MRELLKLRLAQCNKCRETVEGNLALMTLGDDPTDEQVEWLLAKIGEMHLNHSRR
jgi:hypothetical protein